MELLEKIKTFPQTFEQWHSKQPVPMQVAVETMKGAGQGLGIGYVTASFSKSMPQPDLPPNATEFQKQQRELAMKQLKQPAWQQARSFAVLLGLQSGVTLAAKKLRGDKDDAQNTMWGGLAGGTAFSLMTGQKLDQAVFMGVLFGLISGGLYKLGKSFGGDPQKESEYVRGDSMLQALGLSKYSKNLKRGQLTDNTILLWNDSALSEARIPAGPRLLILHHLDSYRASSQHSVSDILQPTLPLPLPLPPTRS